MDEEVIARIGEEHASTRMKASFESRRYTRLFHRLVRRRAGAAWTTHWVRLGGSTTTKDTSMALSLLIVPLAVVLFSQLFVPDQTYPQIT